MDSIRQYLLSVICVCVIVALITSFCQDKKSMSGMVKMISGVLILFTVISPVLKVKLQDFQEFYNEMELDAKAIVRQGETMTNQSIQPIIKEQLEAYILDKASSLNLDLEIDLSLNGSNIPIPERIIICGNASPYGKKMLQTFLAEEVGIPEEMQLWS